MSFTPYKTVYFAVYRYYRNYLYTTFIKLFPESLFENEHSKPKLRERIHYENQLETQTVEVRLKRKCTSLDGV